MTGTDVTAPAVAEPPRSRYWVPEANDDAAAALRGLLARPWLIAGRDDDLIAAIRRNMRAVKDALDRLGWALVTDDREFIRLRKSAPQRAEAFAAGGPSALAWSWFFLIVAAAESMQRRVGIGQLVAAARAAAAEVALDAPGDISERRAIVTALKLCDERGVIIALDGELDGFVHDEAAPVLLEVHHTRLLNVIANYAPSDPSADPHAFLDMVRREPDVGRKIRRRLVDDIALYVTDLDADEVAWFRRRTRDDLQPLADAFGLHLERRAEGATFVAPEGSYRHLKELGPLAFPASGTVAHAALMVCEQANTHGRVNASTSTALAGWIELSGTEVAAFLTAAAAKQSAGTGGWSRELAQDPTGMLRRAVADMLEQLDIVRISEQPATPTDTDDEGGAAKAIDAADAGAGSEVWSFAPIVGRWEQSAPATTAKTARPANVAGPNGGFDLHAAGPLTETNTP